jgi:hypothetical protein
MEEDTPLPFSFPAVALKKVSAAFDGGMLSSDAGVLLLRDVERKCGITQRLSACLRDKRDPDFIKRTVEEMLRLRMLAIAAGYEECNDFDTLRYDPVFKMAAGRLPEGGEALCSEPTLSRQTDAAVSPHRTPRRNPQPTIQNQIAVKKTQRIGAACAQNFARQRQFKLHCLKKPD